MSDQSAEMLQAEASRAFAAVRQVLLNRGLVQKLKSGAVREVAWRAVVWLDDCRAFAFVADIHRLPVPLEKIVDDKVAHQISSALAGRPVRIVNNRGLAVLVGIDIPERPEHRRIPARIALDLDNRPKGRFLVPLGVGVTGPVWKPLAELDAILVGGTRRLGKSMWLNAMLAALMTAHTPEELRVVLIDPKEVELATWEHAPHLLGPIATDGAEAEALLAQVHGELKRRKALLRAAGTVNLAEYNARQEDPDKRLPVILIVVDELSDLAIMAGGAMSAPLQILAAAVMKGGAFGIHAVLSLQRPDSESVAGFLKANLATRISFWFPSATDYRITLNPAGGEPLPSIGRRRPGRMIARLDDGYHVLQGYCLALESRRGIAAKIAAGDTNPGAAVLTRAERAMVRWAMEENDGYLAIADIGQRLEISDWKARQVAAEWEQSGWLAKDPDAANKRRVLVALAGLIEEIENGL